MNQVRERKVDVDGLLSIKNIPHDNFKRFCEVVHELLEDIHTVAGTKTNQGSKDIGVYGELSKKINDFGNKLSECEKCLKDYMEELKSEIKELESSMSALKASDLAQPVMKKKLKQMELQNMERYRQVVIKHKHGISTLKFQSMEKMQHIRTSR